MLVDWTIIRKLKSNQKRSNKNKQNCSKNKQKGWNAKRKSTNFQFVPKIGKTQDELPTHFKKKCIQ